MRLAEICARKAQLKLMYSEMPLVESLLLCAGSAKLKNPQRLYKVFNKDIILLTCSMILAHEQCSASKDLIRRAGSANVKSPQRLAHE